MPNFPVSDSSIDYFTSGNAASLCKLLATLGYEVSPPRLLAMGRHTYGLLLSMMEIREVNPSNKNLRAGMEDLVEDLLRRHLKS
jgi:hypothetical protein